MTTAPARDQLRRLASTDVERVTALLETDFGRRHGPTAPLVHHFLLDALDRGQHDRFVVWPGDDPLGVLYVSATGSTVPAGLVSAGAPLAPAAERAGWRILIGDAGIGGALLDAGSKPRFRRRVSAREQRLMLALEPVAAEPPAGFRPAADRDVEAMTELACRLHVEDQMGAPIAASARGSVRARMAEAVQRGCSWVVERDGTIVAKVDLSLHSRTRGAQIAGVYVAARWRRGGLGSAAVASLTAGLLADGLPGVSLHVRADNAPAVAAYRRAGFVDHGPWVLALR